MDYIDFLTYQTRCIVYLSDPFIAPMCDIRWYLHAAPRRLIYRLHWNIATSPDSSNDRLKFCPNVEINCNSYIHLHRMIFWSTWTEKLIAQVNCSITTTTNVRLLQVSDSKTKSRTIWCFKVIKWIAFEPMHAQQVGLVVGEVNTIIEKVMGSQSSNNIGRLGFDSASGVDATKRPWPWPSTMMENKFRR